MFEARDEARLRAFTSQIAVTLDNAQLFDEVLTVKNYNDSILKSTTNGLITFDAERPAWSPSTKRRTRYCTCRRATN